MSVLVRGMDMPKNCGNCHLRKSNEDRVWCFILGEYICFETEFLGRKINCPLVEIPTPHGRLIDKDKLRRELFWNFNGERIPFYDCDNFPTTLTYRDLHSILSEQPTIIEAEVEDVSSHIRQLAGQAGKILVDAALNAIKESEGSEQ